MAKKSSTAVAQLITSNGGDELDFGKETESDCNIDDMSDEDIEQDKVDFTTPVTACNRRPFTDTTPHASGAFIPPRKLPFHSPTSSKQSSTSSQKSRSSISMDEQRNHSHHAGKTGAVPPAESALHRTLEEILMEVRKANARISSIEERVSLLETSQSSSSADSVDSQKRRVPNCVRVSLYINLL